VVILSKLPKRAGQFCLNFFESCPNLPSPCFFSLWLSRRNFAKIPALYGLVEWITRLWQFLRKSSIFACQYLGG